MRKRLMRIPVMKRHTFEFAGEPPEVRDVYLIDGLEFTPTIDLNDASKFDAAFLAAHPDKGLDIHIHLHKKKPEFGGDISVGAHVWPSPAGDWESTGPSEARARTEAVCAAWNALEGERG